MRQVYLIGAMSALSLACFAGAKGGGSKAPEGAFETSGETETKDANKGLDTPQDGDAKGADRPDDLPPQDGRNRQRANKRPRHAFFTEGSHPNESEEREIMALREDPGEYDLVIRSAAHPSTYSDGYAPGTLERFAKVSGAVPDAYKDGRGEPDQDDSTGAKDHHAGTEGDAGDGNKGRGIGFGDGVGSATGNRKGGSQDYK